MILTILIIHIIIEKNVYTCLTTVIFLSSNKWLRKVLYFPQEAIFEKDAGKVYLKSFSLYKKLLTFSRAGHEQGKATSIFLSMVHVV